MENLHSLSYSRQDINDAERFTAKFAQPAFSSLAEMCASLQPQVLAVALPTEFHFSTVMQILEFKPRAILCEKPIAERMVDGEAMTAAAKHSDCTLLVNYIHRFDAGVLHLKKLIDQGQLWYIYRGCVWYGKGVANNASHFIDLLIYLLGPVDSAALLDRGRDRGRADADPDFILTFRGAKISFMSTCAEAFTLAEIDLLGTQGRLRYINGGATIEVALSEDDRDYPGYQILGAWRPIANDIGRYQWHVVDSLAKLLDGESNFLPSTGETSLATLAVVTDLLESRM